MSIAICLTLNWKNSQRLQSRRRARRTTRRRWRRFVRDWQSARAPPAWRRELSNRGLPSHLWIALLEMARQILEVFFANLRNLIGQVMPTALEHQHLRLIELAAQHLQVVLPVHRHVFLALHDHRPPRTARRRFDAFDP